jgi:hypothetical protein
MKKSIKKYFSKAGGLAIYLTILSFGLTSCNNGDVTFDSASVEGGSSSGVLATCDEIKPGAHFNGGSGSANDPYLICSEQQLLNISLAVIGAKPSISSAGTVKFPYMGKAFKLGKSLNFAKSEVEFFSIGHLMGSLGRSSAISGSDKNLIATHDKRNITDYVSKLSSQRIPFSGQLDGNGNTIEIGDYAPTESRLVGLFSVLSPGAIIKNLILKNFNIYAKGGVNIGCLAGSILKSDQTQIWQNFGLPQVSKKIVLDKIKIEGCSLYDVVANSAALVGLVRSYSGEDVSITNIALSKIYIDGGSETNLEPAYGDDFLQASSVRTRMHNIGTLVGYFQVDGKATLNNIILDDGKVSLESYYTGIDRVTDVGDIRYASFGIVDDVDSIYSLFDTGLSDQFSENDPANSVGALLGAFNTSSNLARVSISNIAISNSQNIFQETTRASGIFAGSIGLLGGIVSFQDISLKDNLVKFGINDFSLPSNGVGLMAGSLSVGSSGASYSFSKIKVDGQIVSDNAEDSSNISGFFGSINALDEVVLKDNKITFSEIDIAGTAVLGGIDIKSLGSFAGSLSGNASASSSGANKISLSKVNNEFIISTPDNYAMVVGGLAGYLGEGNYSLSDVTVRTQIDTSNLHGLYNFVNAIVGMFSSKAEIVISNSSYDATLRPEFLTGIPKDKDNFVEL